MNITAPRVGEKLEVKVVKDKKSPLPPFNLVGNGLSTRHGTSLDIIDVCVQMNLGELRVLQAFRNEFTYACMRGEEYPNIIVPTKMEEWSDYLSIALKKNYAHLKHLRVIIRVHRGKYILNPYLFMYGTNYGAVQAKWDELAAQIKEDS